MSLASLIRSTVRGARMARRGMYCNSMYAGKQRKKKTLRMFEEFDIMTVQSVTVHILMEEN